MRKQILTKIFVILALAVLLSVSSLAADTGDRVRIDEDGGVTVTSDHAGKEGISSLQLSLTVEPEDQAAGVSFVFADTPAKIAESRYHEEDGTLNLYLAGTKPLFDESGSLKIGTVADGSGNALPASIRVVENSLKYVYGTDVKAMSGEGAAEPSTDPEPELPSEGPRPEGEEELRQALDTAKTYAPENYTEASYQALKKAMEEAEAVLNDPTRTKERLEEALRNLENALGALVLSDRAAGPVVNNPGSGTGLGADTGDPTRILPWVILLVAAIVVMIVVLVVAARRRRSAPFGTRRRRRR